MLTAWLCLPREARCFPFLGSICPSSMANYFDFANQASPGLLCKQLSWDVKQSWARNKGILWKDVTAPHISLKAVSWSHSYLIPSDPFIRLMLKNGCRISDRMSPREAFCCHALQKRGRTWTDLSGLLSPVSRGQPRTWPSGLPQRAFSHTVKHFPKIHWARWMPLQCVPESFLKKFRRSLYPAYFEVKRMVCFEILKID